MTKEEISIGDYVLWYGKTIVKVLSIRLREGIVSLTKEDSTDTDDYWIEAVTQSGSLCGFHINHAEPLILTKKILKSFGFSHGHDNFYYIPSPYGEDTSIEIILHKDTYELSINMNTWNNDAMFEKGGLTSVHQFQQALRTCGLLEFANSLNIESYATEYTE